VAERSLTILQLLPALRGGGVERGTLEISQAILARGWRSLTMSAGGPMVDELTGQGAQHITAAIGRKAPWVLRHVHTLRSHISRFHVDIVHARSRLPAWLALIALRSLPKTRRPAFVTTVHGLNSVSRYSEIMTRGDAVITVSKACELYVLKHYPACQRARLHCIPRGVDPAVFRHGMQPDPRWQARFTEQFPTTRNGKIVTLAGRIARRKGADILLRLVSKLNRSGTRCCGLVVGGAAPGHRVQLEHLKAQAAHLGIADRVVFTGARDDVREIMAVSDLILSLSGKPESFGRTVLEALSLGRPVAGWAHGGVAELLTTLYPAGAVPVGDEAALLTTVTGLLADPDPVSENQPFTLSRMLESTLDLYQSLAENRP